MRQILFVTALSAVSLTSSQALLASDTGPGTAPSPLPTVENFALIDHQGKHHELDYYCSAPSTRGVVLFIQGNGCPLVQKRVPELERLRSEYQSQGILFAMLNANPQDTRTEIAAEAESFGIGMPVLVDESQAVAQMLGVTRTATAFLIDAESKQVFFRGPVDDRMSYGKERPEASHHYLRDAIDSLLAGQPAAEPVVDAPGCKVSLADPDAALTYVSDIAPILKQRCVTCHTSGGIAPFAMSSYRKVKGWSEMISEVVLTRQMPPWHADPHVGERFSNDCGISPEETQQLVGWIRSGSPRGDGDDPLEGYRPELPEWHLGEPPTVIDLPEQKVAAEGVFDYRYVTLDNPFESDVWLTGTEINPGNTRVLHHVIVMAVHPEDKRQEKWITGYAPGTSGSLYPDGSAVRLPAGWKLRFQLHYTASGKEETDSTRLSLHFSTEPAEKEFKTAIVMNTRFKIPAGAREHPEEKTITLGKESTLYAINPHMHFRGKRMSFTAQLPDGQVKPILSVPDYDFNWQRTYVLEEPLRLPAGTKIEVRNAWDNSDLNPHNPDPTRDVRWGDQSFEEMFFATLGYIEAGEG